MSWDPAWKLPPTGAEMYMSDGGAETVYSGFLASLKEKGQLETYESLLEAQIRKVYPNYPIKELKDKFNSAKNMLKSSGGSRRSRTRKLKSSRKHAGKKH
jgi:hypothetical protein